MEKSVMQNFSSFLVKLFIYSIVVYFAIRLVGDNIPAKFQYPHTIYLVVFFFVVTAVFHLGMLRNASKSGGSIIRYFMMATAIKFFLYMLVMIAYGLLKPQGAAGFISNFFLVYLFITVFEVSVIYSHFKNKSTENKVGGSEKNR